LSGANTLAYRVGESKKEKNSFTTLTTGPGVVSRALPEGRYEGHGGDRVRAGDEKGQQGPRGPAEGPDVPHQKRPQPGQGRCRSGCHLGQ